MSKELFETLPLKWRALSGLKLTANVFYLWFLVSLFLAYRLQIFSYPVFVAASVCALWANHIVDRRMFWAYEKSVNYLDCLGYIVVKWSVLLIIISASWSLNVMGFETFNFFDTASTNLTLLSVSAIFFVLYVAAKSLANWAEGVSFKTVIDNSFGQDISALIAESALCTIPHEYHEVRTVETFIAIAEDNNFVSLAEVLQAYNTVK